MCVARDLTWGIEHTRKASTTELHPSPLGVLSDHHPICSRTQHRSAWPFPPSLGLRVTEEAPPPSGTILSHVPAFPRDFPFVPYFLPTSGVASSDFPSLRALHGREQSCTQKHSRPSCLGFGWGPSAIGKCDRQPRQNPKESHFLSPGLATEAANHGLSSTCGC